MKYIFNLFPTLKTLTIVYNLFSFQGLYHVIFQVTFHVTQVNIFHTQFIYLYSPLIMLIDKHFIMY